MAHSRTPKTITKAERARRALQALPSPAADVDDVPDTQIERMIKHLPPGSLQLAVHASVEKAISRRNVAIQQYTEMARQEQAAITELVGIELERAGHDPAKFQCVATDTRAKDAPTLLLVPNKKVQAFAQAIR